MADPKVRLARAIVGFCKDLEQGNGEVARLWRSAEQALGQQQADNGLKTAVESLGQYTHKKASELTTSGASMTKAAIHMAEVVSKEAVKTARDDNNKVLEALALGVQADVLILASETTKAIKVANAAASLFRRLDDKSGEAAVLGSITTAYLVKANAGFNPQLEMADKADEKIEQIRQKRETETDLALEAAKEIVTLHRALGDRKSEAQALDKVAEIHLMKEEPDQCKAVAREERSLYQELNDVHGEAAALQTIINANLQNVDDYDDALIAAKDMVKLFRGRDRKTYEEDKKGTADALQAMAKVLLQKLDLAEALESGEEAMKLYTELGDKKLSAPCCHTLSQIHMSMEKPAAAIKCARQAVDEYHEAGDTLAEANALHDLAVMDVEDLLAEVEKDPKSFTKEQAERMNAAWQPLEESLALYKQLKHTEGEFYVTETINNVLERSRQIHIRVADPIKTYYITDPNDREKTYALHIYDTTRVGAAALAAEGAAELEDE